MEEELHEKMMRETREMNDEKRRSFLSTMNEDNKMKMDQVTNNKMNYKKALDEQYNMRETMRKNENKLTGFEAKMNL